MSHYSVMVIGPQTDEELAELMAPFDEDIEGPQRKDYETGNAEDYWLVKHLRRNQDHHKNGTGLEEKDLKSFSYSKPSVSKEEKAAEYKEDSDQCDKFLSTPATWEEVAALYNHRYPEEPMEYDEGGAYTWTTYNADSKWDWYQVGGRWAGYLHLHSDKLPVQPVNFSWGWKEEDKAAFPKNRADRAQVKDIDFNAWKGESFIAANKLYDRYEAFVNQHGHVPQWKPRSGCDMETYRAEYNSNPVVIAAREEFEDLGHFFNAATEFGGLSRGAYVARSVNGVVPCYATLMEDGTWVAPGSMGWFGMGSDDDDSRAEYQAKINQMLAELDPETWITVVDCHI